MDWNKRKVLVTGAGGFIGSHLCEALIERGADVTAMIRYTSRGDWGNLEHLADDKKNALKVIAGDVEDSHFVNRNVAGMDTVFHLAALIGIPYSYVAPASYVRTNIEGTVNILEAARVHGIRRVVQTSTSETYGTAIYTPIDEKHPLQPQSPYSASKIGSDMLADSFFRTFDLPVAIIRPFNTYGPRQSARAVIPSIITQAFAAPEIKLGSLAPIRDMTFVKDTARGFIHMAESDGAIGKVINIGNGRGISIGDLVVKILAIMNVKKPVVTDEQRNRPAASEVFELVCANAQADKILGWKPEISLDQGLQSTIDFIGKNLHLYKIGHYAV